MSFSWWHIAFSVFVRPSSSTSSHRHHAIAHVYTAQRHVILFHCPKFLSVWHSSLGAGPTAVVTAGAQEPFREPCNTGGLLAMC